ncbi:hypothetical protein, partial [Endozoicomonas sp. SESOKO2]|uniref:hypothetical protein n=1 Tax=Endozoicomonas sp. SESOKO2 TaxID=2828743 RepID=UPI002148EB0F
LKAMPRCCNISTDDSPKLSSPDRSTKKPGRTRFAVSYHWLKQSSRPAIDYLSFSGLSGSSATLFLSFIATYHKPGHTRFF